MVNYLYDPARIEEYHEDYAGAGKRNASTAVRRLAAGLVDERPRPDPCRRRRRTALTRS